MPNDPTIATLTTVNAPHRRQVTADELARCLLDSAEARHLAGHMSVFFGELPLGQQQTFCRAKGIGDDVLTAAALAFGKWSGENYPAAILK